MESEKVKEIKKALECCVNDCDRKCSDCFYRYKGCWFSLDKDILTLINELESENSKFKGFMERNEWESIEDMETTLDKAQEKCFEVAKENQQLKDRITKLEKEIEENAFYSKGYAQGIKNTYEVVIPEKLKQFAERLKEKAEYDYLANYNTNDEPFIEKPDFLRIVDQTLKEFINLNKGE